MFDQMTNQQLFDGYTEAITHGGNWKAYEKEIRKRGLGWRMDSKAAP